MIEFKWSAKNEGQYGIRHFCHAGDREFLLFREVMNSREIECSLIEFVHMNSNEVECSLIEFVHKHEHIMQGGYAPARYPKSIAKWQSSSFELDKIMAQSLIFTLCTRR